MLSAHGVGGGSDLPIPASMAILGGMAALLVSFAVLAMAWRTPRYESGADGRPAPAVLARLVDHPAYTVVLRTVGLAGLGFVVLCAVAGKDDLSNPVFGIVYVLLWVGLVPASLLLGPVVRSLSPVRTLHYVLTAVLPVDRERGLVRLPARVGMWPAAAGLLAFVWLELVSPSGIELNTLRWWIGAYLVLMVGGGLLFGTRWFGRADPFEVYSTLVGHLSIWGRGTDRGLVIRSPLRNLAQVRSAPGLVAVVAVLLGSTAFDSVAGSVTWLRFTQSTDRNVTLVETALLLLACGIVGAMYVAATAAPRPRPGVSRWDLPVALAHSIVPIVVGYVVAHYITLLVETGQLTLIQASDPLGNGADIFGIADRQVDIWLSLHPSFLASVKVVAIVAGHVIGAVAAHDRALARLPVDSQTRGQLPLLAVMVAYTFSGLYLLFGL